jgi:hypothetical protein
MKKNSNKKLALRVETLRNLTPDEMSQVNGGAAWYCWTIVVPSSGIFTLIPITMTDCD